MELHEINVTSKLTLKLEIISDYLGGSMQTNTSIKVEECGGK